MANVKDHQPLFESKERLRSSEIKERQRDDDHQPLFESKERQRSSEIKEDGLRFVEHQRGDNSFKVVGFESNERLRSSEIKEDGLRFVLRVSEELYLNIY